MKKSIWKYPFYVNDYIGIDMPKGAEILTVQMQGGEPCIWALVDITAEIEKREFNLFGTGHPIGSNPGKYIGTFQLHGGALVFHLFEL